MNLHISIDQSYHCFSLHGKVKFVKDNRIRYEVTAHYDNKKRLASNHTTNNQQMVYILIQVG